MDIILKESDRLNSIITNFLGYARPMAGNFSATDVAEAIRDTLTLLKHSPDVLDAHKLTAELGNQNVMIMADISQLKQIFWNLARNSLQAMPDGGELRVSVEHRPNNRIRITFTDTGTGMSPDQVEQLFEPFSNSTSGGTGLGLSIVYQIVKDHNGVINVRSRQGKGTTITIDLPRENRPPAESEEQTQETRLQDFLNIANK
jgi:two-component system sensor histidine kinase PilS (NtrC family)